MTTDPARLKALRKALITHDLDGYLIPLTDEHMSEYVGAYAGRLAWLTGFTGSAGMAIVTLGKAAIFTDGRYRLQVAQEVDPAVFALEALEGDNPLHWLKDAAETGARIGYDPELFNTAWLKQARSLLDGGEDIHLVSTRPNLIDTIWDTQPAPPMAKGFVHEDRYAGESSAEKRQRLGRQIGAAGADFAAISMLDNIAWLLNIRGSDVENTPVMRGYALLFADGSATVFTEEEKVDDALRAHLGNEVSVEPRDAFYARLAALGEKGLTAQLDPMSNNARIFETVQTAGGKIVEGRDPTTLAKAIKNPVEQQGSRDAHVRDGVSVTRFLHWLSQEAPKGGIDELSAAAKLWDLRSGNALLRDRSFNTISGAGPNGALCHYRVSEETNRPLETDMLYLVDSGGQYLDGTTDITRTIAVGTPSQEMRKHYTLVLKGHIALATAKFPSGTPGLALDAYARRPLWDAGLDFDHGTGHGVGSYLAVHEGPQRIAKAGSLEPIRAGMILSNEPGFYKDNSYGIRIENLVLVVPVDTEGDRDMLGFETLTFAPLDRTLIDITLLSGAERNWVNTYHQTVRDKVSQGLEGDAADWLYSATEIL